MSTKVTAAVIAKNEEKDIADCFASLVWVDELILLDGGSTDGTLDLARKAGAKIHQQTGHNFSQWRNEIIKLANHDWLLYLDADERISPELKKEIKQVISESKAEKAAYEFPRRNFLLGKELRYGGWWPDYVPRLFNKKSLKKWTGELHETPVIDGEVDQLKATMIHIQPDSIEPMLKKSIKWSKIEAEELFDAGHPPVVWWRLLRMGLTTLFNRLVKKQGWRDGTEGWIMSIYQAFHTVLVYCRLWEMQKKVKLKTKK